MPTDISNALGTARQFTPQPDALYQPRLSGVAAIQQGVASITNHELAAANLSKIMNSLNAYGLNKERRQDAWGLEKAKRMINGMTAEDIMALDITDALQSEEYADVRDNPYFVAYASKLQGEYLNTRQRQEYDAMYAESPAKSVDEEVARYKKHQSEWVKSNLKVAPINQTAFDMGYNESGVVNMTSLANKFTEKQIQERQMETHANVSANLSQIALKRAQNGEGYALEEMINDTQTIFNEERVAAMPAQLRYQAGAKFLNELVKTGGLTEDDALTLMDTVTLQTRMDGTRRTLAEVADPFSIRQQATIYADADYEKMKYDFVQEFSGDVNLDRYWDTVTNEKNPRRKRALLEAESSITSKIEADKRAKAREAIKLAEQEAKSTLQQTWLTGDFAAWSKGHEWYAGDKLSGSGRVPDGKGGFTAVDPDEAITFFRAKLGEITQQYEQGDKAQAREWLKLMTYPPFSEIRNLYRGQYMQGLRNIVAVEVDDSGEAVIPDDVKMLLSAYKYDSSGFQNAFGNDITREIRKLNRYVESSGSWKKGLEMFARDNTTEPEVKQMNRSAIQSLLNKSAFTIENVLTLGDHGPDSGNVTTVWINENQQARVYVEAQAIDYMNQGYSADMASRMAWDELQKECCYYHTAFLPKKLFSNIGTDMDLYWASKVLDSYVYKVAGDGDANDVIADYNDMNSTMSFRHNGNVITRTIEDIKKEAYERAKNSLQPAPKYFTSEAINAAVNQRYAIGVDEDDLSVNINDNPGTD